MKKVWSFLLALVLAQGLCANQAPATASDAMSKHIAKVKKFVNTNERELKHAAIITSNLAKIGGAIALVTSTCIDGKFLKNLSHGARKGFLSMKNENKENPTFSDWITPVTLMPKNESAIEIKFNNNSYKHAIILDEASWMLTKLPRPPYFIGFPISAFLLYNGSHGIYKEIRSIIAEQKKVKPTKPTTKAEAITTEQDTPVAPVQELQPTMPVVPVVIPVVQEIPVNTQVTEPATTITKSMTIEPTEAVEPEAAEVVVAPLSIESENVNEK